MFWSVRVAPKAYHSSSPPTTPTQHFNNAIPYYIVELYLAVQKSCQDWRETSSVKTANMIEIRMALVPKRKYMISNFHLGPLATHGFPLPSNYGTDIF